MKKIATLLMLLSLGLFTIGCGQQQTPAPTEPAAPAEPAPEGETPAPDATPEATPDAAPDAAPPATPEGTPEATPESNQ